MSAEIWDDSAAPGGHVCAELPDGPDGAYCGQPVESEPCPIHGRNEPEEPLDLDAIEARETAATPGPWERGYVWLTDRPMFDANQNHVAAPAATHCAYCHLGEPDWSGQADFYGCVTLVHRHRHPDPPRTETGISGANGNIVASEILTPQDTAFITAARADVPALISEVKRLREELDTASRQATMARVGVETLRSDLKRTTGMWRQAEAATATQRARLAFLVADWEQQLADHAVYERCAGEVRKLLNPLAGRPTTPDRVHVVDGRTVTTITVQRCCNGCGLPIGDATEDELFAPLTGEPLPDVRSECPKCSPAVEVSADTDRRDIELGNAQQDAAEWVAGIAERIAAALRPGVGPFVKRGADAQAFALRSLATFVRAVAASPTWTAPTAAQDLADTFGIPVDALTAQQDGAGRLITTDMSKIETVATYEDDGSTYEIEHLGICRDSQWGEFAIYRDGKQVTEFALTEAMLRNEFRPAELPVTAAELITLAREACREVPDV